MKWLDCTFSLAPLLRDNGLDNDENRLTFEDSRKIDVKLSGLMPADSHIKTHQEPAKKKYPGM